MYINWWMDILDTAHCSYILNDICTVHTLEICMNMFVILTIFIWLRIKHTLGNNTNEHYKETVKSLINDGWRITTMKFFTWLVCVRNALVWYWERKCLTVEIILLKTSLVRTGFSSSMFFWGCQSISLLSKMFLIFPLQLLLYSSRNIFRSWK